MSPAPAALKPVLRLFQVPPWLASSRPDVAEEALRVRWVERDLGLPAKGVVLAILYYYLFFSTWFQDAVLYRQGIVEVVQFFLWVYLILNALSATVLVFMDRLPFGVVRDAVLVMCLVDALFLGAVTSIAGGYDSILFWIFLGLIVRNAISVPLLGRQVLLNSMVTTSFVAAGFLEETMVAMEVRILDPATVRALYPEGPETPTEPVILRVFLLLLMTACVYGVQVLFQKQRRVEEETRETAQRQQQLESAGRLAAEIAHQLKNPLGIINNAAYTLQRTVREGKTITQQIQIIREEVDRSDRIITELMGYARLAEGRVEKLDVVEELEAAVARVFPPAVQFEVKIHRDYGAALPSLLMQRTHLSEILVNLLHNAREALGGRGNLSLSAHVAEDYSVRLSIADDGPGIPPESVERVFEAYYTTRDKGSGLGLAIVKHNTELYAGRVSVESVLGQGAKFVLEFPAKTVMRLRR